MDKPRRALKYWLLYWKQQVIRALAQIEDVSPDRVLIGNQHVFRLLNLRVWCLRYHVSLNFILRFLLFKYYTRYHPRNYNKGIITLGVAIPTLCSNGSRQALEREILECFPGNENDHMYRSQLIERAVHYASPCHVDITNELYTDTQHYIKALQARRKRLDHSNRFKRRPWRDNPWQ